MFFTIFKKKLTYKILISFERMNQCVLKRNIQMKLTTLRFKIRNKFCFLFGYNHFCV